MDSEPSSNASGITDDLLNFIFQEEPFYFEDELPDLWEEELGELINFPIENEQEPGHTASVEAQTVESQSSIFHLLHQNKSPQRVVGLNVLNQYAQFNLVAEDRILPKLFYQILLILAESQIRQIEGRAMNDWLTSDHKEQIHTALNEKWLDPDSRSALGSLL